MPHHCANGDQCQLAARGELIFAAPPCTAGWVPAAVHTILRWCSGSPAERVRFSGPDDEARTGETKQHFLTCGFSRRRVLARCPFCRKKCLIPNTHTLSGQRSRPPTLGTRPHRKTQCACEPARWLRDESHEGGRPNGPAKPITSPVQPQIT